MVFETYYFSIAAHFVVDVEEEACRRLGSGGRDVVVCSGGAEAIGAPPLSLTSEKKK